MMTADEFARGARAGIELLRLNKAGFARFDGTNEAALRSFWIAPLGLPSSLLATFLVRESPLAESDPLLFGMLQTVVYAIGWMAYPVAAHALAGMLGRGAPYARYLTGYNWLNLYLNLASSIAASLLALAGAPVGAVVLASVALLVVYVGYAFFAARAGLGLEPHQVVGFVILDIALSLTIDAFAVAAAR
jgi:hypothetical protein